MGIVLNLAEGSAKLGAKERRKFFTIAFGSLREVQACLTVANRHELNKQTDQLAGAIYRLMYLCKTLGPVPEPKSLWLRPLAPRPGFKLIVFFLSTDCSAQSAIGFHFRADFSDPARKPPALGLIK
jgi:hypothetical protein